MTIDPRVLRAVARDQLARLLPQQSPAAREELATSVVRQWATGGGCAGVFTPEAHYWLRVVQVDGRVAAAAEELPGTLGRHLAGWRAVDHDVPRILLDLSVAQHARFASADGLTVRVRVDAKERTFHFDEVPPGDADDL